MKHTKIIFALILLLAFLSACGGNSYVMVRYETYELMQKELPFMMKAVPELEDALVYGTMDGKLGEIVYSVTDENDYLRGKLSIRMAELSYKDEYSTDTMPGISGVVCGDAAFEERIGSYTVTYYVSGQTVVAVWDENDYSYALIFNENAELIDYLDIRPYAIAVISTRG